MMEDVITYTIGGVEYRQRHLTNLQQTLVEEMLFDTMQDGVLSVVDAPSFFRALGASRGRLMAICLIPGEMDVKAFVQALQRPGYIDAQIEHFDDAATPGDRYKVIHDFFVCNQIGSCIDSLTNLISWIGSKMDESQKSRLVNGSKNSAPLSPEATPATAMPSTP